MNKTFIHHVVGIHGRENANLMLHKSGRVSFGSFGSFGAFQMMPLIHFQSHRTVSEMTNDRQVIFNNPIKT